MSAFKFHGLCPATHTPFHADGSLNLAVVEKQAEHLLARKIDRVFIGGTTATAGRRSRSRAASTSSSTSAPTASPTPQPSPPRRSATRPAPSR
jgi:hypothetical protein